MPHDLLVLTDPERDLLAALALKGGRLFAQPAAQEQCRHLSELLGGGNTLTPSLVTGSFHLNREVFDQREGNPYMSAAIWAEVERAYAAALESRAAAALAALSGTTNIALSGTGSTLVTALRRRS